MSKKIARISGAKRQVVPFTLGEDELAVLNAVAFKLGLSRSRVIYGWVQPHLEEYAEDPVIQQIMKLKMEGQE